jgi:hypothetical protein
MKLSDLPQFDSNFRGSLGESRGKSTDYVKSIPQGTLKVHAPNGIVTGAKLNNQPISNYEASILDLQGGRVHKNTGKF